MSKMTALSLPSKAELTPLVRNVARQPCPEYAIGDDM